ncbi:PREDICTED: E3 ubiquitin-protein ligase RNF4-like isoform X2 [Amphimedon queenslandica]|uniref:RING-type domain-containing protein n=1 Tax=Amphimedon queenslandica TaxID=400682 RepID=A0AAN0K4F2_AMPQE|nr:PREDICTED: E3 ubiquitin-protein ligase RNF4-like isoform X2 [Amphimedon queenslandica]|eukprot:XP_019864413.1 PREDICTED: E3 ubiquitin-protein ligase RNF4-like isoform X2 [Amphimedon queenslandica]
MNDTLADTPSGRDSPKRKDKIESVLSRTAGLRVAALRMAESNEELPPPPGEEGMATNTTTDSTPPQYIDLTNDSFIDLTTQQSPSIQRYSHSSSSSETPISPDVVFISQTYNNDDCIISSARSSSSSSKRLKKTEEKDTALADSKKLTLSCPVCLETVPQFESKGRKVSATICGHIFCNYCIRNAIITSHKCPSCRKTLTLKQYHQLYL